SSSAKTARPCSASSKIKLDVKYSGTECSRLNDRGAWLRISLDCSFINYQLRNLYQEETKLKMLLKLTKITIMPTATIIDFAEMRLDTLAAMGDAAALPITRPHMASQCNVFSMVINVSELSKAIKNRE